MGFDQQLYEDMIQLLLEDCPHRIDQLKSAIDAHNLEAAQHASHSLKGLAANFSASEAIRAAAVIERGALDGRWDRVTAGFPQLQEEFKVFLKAIESDRTRRESPGVAEKRLGP